MEFDKISIIMPAFNVSRYIEKSISSVQSQNYENWELIIIDDGSTDNTMEIVQRMSKKDIRIKAFNNIGNGVSSARNRGLSLSEGAFITFLDADDMLFENALQMRAIKLKENSSIKWVFCVAELVDKDSKKLGWQIGTKEQISFLDMHSSQVHLNCIMGRSDLLKKYKFKEGLTNGEDWLFISDILRGNNLLYGVEGTSVAYRIHKSSTVSKDMIFHENKLIEVLKIMYSSRCDLPHVSTVFTEGLETPPYEISWAYRRFTLLTCLIISREEEYVDKVINELIDFDFELLIRSQIKGMIKFQIMRFYASRDLELEKQLKKDKESILDFIYKFQIDNKLSHYAKIIKTIIYDICRYGYKATMYDLRGLKERKSYLLYGTGSMAVRVTKAVKLLGSEVIFYSDTNSEKWGTKFLEKKVISPMEIMGIRNNFEKIIIASSFDEEITEFLLGLGFDKSQDMIVITK